MTRDAKSKDHAVRWQNRIVGHGEEAPDQLLANPRNWRVHPKSQQDAMAGVLSRVGWVQQVIVNRRTGHVLDGHMRVSIAISRGEPSVPVTYVDVPEDEEPFILATFDPLGALAASDREQVDGLVDEARELTRDDAVQALLDGLAAGSRATSDTAFLGRFLEQGEDEGGGDHGQPEADWPSRRYVQVSYSMTPDQRETVLQAIRQAKQARGAATSAEALVAICEQYIGGNTP